MTAGTAYLLAGLATCGIGLNAYPFNPSVMPSGSNSTSNSNTSSDQGIGIGFITTGLMVASIPFVGAYFASQTDEP